MHGLWFIRWVAKKIDDDVMNMGASTYKKVWEKWRLANVRAKKVLMKIVAAIEADYG